MNQWMFEQVNALARATPWLHPAARSYAEFGVVVCAALLVTGWWVARRTGDPARVAAAVAAGAATLIAVAVNQPLVNAVHEARPYTVLPHILVLTGRSTDASFPSDHATMAGAVAAGVWIVARRLGILATIAAVLMAFTRVYIAAHYPADVAAGLLLGAVVAALTWLLTRHALTRLIEVLCSTRLRPILTATPHPEPMSERP